MLLYNYYSELKNRVLLSFLSGSSVVIVTYYYKEIIIFLVIKPTIILFNDSFLYFIFTNLTEIFSAYINFSYFIGAQALVVYFLYHFFIFLIPGMYFFEYNKYKLVFTFSIFLWIFSILFLNNFLMPAILLFFYNFQETSVNQAYSFHYEARITEYLELYKTIYYVWCLNCQVWVLIYLFLDLFKTKFFYIKKFRRIFYFMFLIIATIVSPPEILSQIIISFLMSTIFEIMVFVIILKSNLATN